VLSLVVVVVDDADNAADVTV